MLACSEHRGICCAHTPQIKQSTGSCVQRAHNGPSAGCSIRIKRRYAVLKGRRERDIVRPPTPVQMALELPTVTTFYSGN